MRLKVTQQGMKENVAKAQARSESLAAAHALKPGSIAASLLNLQRTHGNRYVQRLLNQAAIQRKRTCGGTYTSYRSASAYQEQDMVQHILQRKGSGQPLEPGVRAFMEKRFGEDFSGVRAHTGAHAAQTAERLDAVAYTIGRDIFFSRGQYLPQTMEGKRLLAHELTHVVQQESPISARTRLLVSEPEDSFEQEAESVSEAIMATGPESRQPSTYLAGPLRVGGEQGASPQGQNSGVTAISANFSMAPVSHPTIRLRHPYRIQRTAKFVKGPVHPVWNLADQIVIGEPAGLTLPVLNDVKIQSIVLRLPIGKVVIPSQDFQIRLALRPPTIETNPLPTGQVECGIQSVGDNVGSFDMTLVNAGPWTTLTSIANVIAAALAPPTCKAGGNAVFRVRGIPTDADLAAKIKTHEDRHAADYDKAFNAIVVPWDKKLTGALGMKYTGADGPSCEEALFRDMGGTPDDIANNLFYAWNKMIEAFHSRPAGQNLQPRDPQANADCSQIFMEITSPPGALGPSP